MYYFSKTSKEHLDTCHNDLIIVCKEAIKLFDFAVIHGYRGEELQNKLVEEGKSKLKYPYSKHNRKPSHAVDVCPYVVGVGCDWENINNFYYLAGIFKGIAFKHKINLFWGGAWKNFKDYGHFELS